MGKQSSSGWGYALDYNAEIAADEVEVARLSSEAAIVASAWNTKHVMQATALDVLFSSPAGVFERAALMGIEVEELAEIYVSVDADDYSGYYETMTERPSLPLRVGARKRGDVLVDLLASLWPGTEKQRAAALTKAKARLARHKRNASKYGA